MRKALRATSLSEERAIKRAAHFLLVLSLSALLMGPPSLLAASSLPEGYVLASQQALLGPSELRAGTNLFPGDVVSTSRNGAIQISFDRVKLGMPANSAARIRDDSGIPAIDLLEGSLTFHTRQSGAFHVHSRQLWLATESETPSHATVYALRNGNFIVEIFKGAISAILGGRSYPIPKGGAYRVEVQPLPEKGPVSGRTKKRRVLIIFIGAASAAVGVAIWNELHEHEGPVVSPTVP